MFDKETVMNMMARQLAEGMSKFPPDVQRAFANTEVLILRGEREIRIVSLSLTGNEDEARRVSQGLGNALIPLLARVIGGFKCQVKFQT